ncbi:DUF947-domain-containing protein [Rhizodiscina lignyota]|uniref:rRNA biogenesis protein RRP36 n=1 Tax=Rhizodiscina lignyota TaxID=1504668 RepID=A0A9P4M7L3_9PEZI|nr:DUF947-domain-containing protein [Rhizodiscina lignyota]
MPLLKTLSRYLRARDDDSASDPYSDELEGSSPSILDTGDADAIEESDEELEEAEGQEDTGGEDNSSDESDNSGVDGSKGDDIQAQLRKVPFGALAKAQTKIERDEEASRKRKRGDLTSGDTEAKLEALRERLRELRGTKRGHDEVPAQRVPKTLDKKEEGFSKNVGQSRLGQDSETSSEDSESDSEPDAAPTSQFAKRSKHAPMAMPSNKAVSRKRSVVSSDRPASSRPRDPRFMPITGPKPTQDKVAKNYEFLNDYRQSEIADLKGRLGEAGKGKKKDQKRKSKGEKLSAEEKDRLKKELTRMESQEQARREKQRLEDVAKKHKREEKEKVAEGKKAFFLKKSEQKKLALIDKFEGMKGKQRDRAIDRRRKKIAVRERRAMPAARRGTSG